MHVDIQPLHFQQQKDRHVQQLTFISALFDSQGKLAGARQSDVLLALRDDSLQKLSTTGFNARLYLEAPPGNYNLREVVFEEVDGKMTTSTRTVQIR